jgi:hypothetical protein
VAAEDEAGNLSDTSSPLGWILGEGLVQTVSSPVISHTQIITDGSGGFHGVVTWQAVGTANLSEFKIYRQDGLERPSSTTTMMEVGTVAVERGADLGYNHVYSFTDTFLGIEADELIWYAVEAVPLIGSAIASEPFPARFVDLDDLSYRPMSTFMPRRAEWTGDHVVFELADRAACCYILFRSGDGANDFSQISPIFADSGFVDRDVRPGDTAFYQILQIDAGQVNYTTNQIEPFSASGEIVAYTPVFEVAIPAGDPPPALMPMPPVPQQPLNGRPAQLQFGPNWTVQVRAYSSGTNLGNGTARVSGEGAVVLDVTPLLSREVRVSFVDVIIDASGGVQSIDAGGHATIHSNELPVLFPDRWRYSLQNMRLDQNGAFADITLFSVDSDLRHWQVATDGPGGPIFVSALNQPILNPSLAFSRTVDVSQGCEDDPLTLKFPFAVTDWPLLIVPTGSFTVTHLGVDFGPTCTLYRDRFVNENHIGDPLDGVLDYRNDRFLGESYSSTNATYSLIDGVVWLVGAQRRPQLSGRLPLSI